MKKLIVFVLLITLVIFLCACDDETVCQTCGASISETDVVCANCGSAVSGDQTINTDQVTAPSATDSPHTHSYSSQVTAEATCNQAGVNTFTCQCGDTYTEQIPATGQHAWEPAICTAPKTCATCQLTEGSAIAHSYTSKITTAATCKNDGVKTFSCPCGASYTEKIPASHTWKTATCTTPKICTVCKTTSGKPIAHVMSNGRCSRCGYETTIVLYEDSFVKISFQKAEKGNGSGSKSALYFYIENKTNQTLSVQPDAISVNGYSFCDIDMYAEITAYSLVVVEASLNDIDVALVDLNAIVSIGAQFRIIDEATSKAYNAIFTNIKLDGSGIGTKPTDFVISNLLYSDDKCTMCFKNIITYAHSHDRAEIYLYIDNKTANTLLIQADSITINGHRFTNISMHDHVLPMTIGIVKLAVEDFDRSVVNIGDAVKVGGQLSVTDNVTLATYKAIFSDIFIQQ